jgi:hypothetical protein
MCQYIAMWSGPRNISTALMRAWDSRPDTTVCDEPFYAHYLLATGHVDHPGYEQIILAHETDWRKVLTWLTGPIPDGKPIFYQKHMAHHLLPGMSVEWIHKVSNCFLIREPREMLLSLIEFLPSPTLEETGLSQLVRLFERVADCEKAVPPVIDATDVLRDPRRMLRSLCDQLHVPFYEEMLSWPAGPRESDGAWAPYWYQNIYNSTGFAPHRSRTGEVPQRLRSLLEQCNELYEQLYRHRLQPKSDPSSSTPGETVCRES